MDHFQIHYKYAREVASEALAVWWLHKFRLMIGAFLAGAAVFLILGLFFRHPIWIFPAVICVCGAGSFLVREKMAVNAEMRAIKSLYHIEQPSVHVDLAEKIVVKVSNMTKQHEWNETEGYLETKRMIVLMLKGNRTVALPKNGFVRGTPEACLEFLAARGLSRK